MPPPTDILFAHLGDLTASSRALRQLRALAADGFRVTALGTGPLASPESIPDAVTAHTVAVGTGSGPRWFWSAHRAFARAVAAHPARVYLASDLFVLPALARAARRGGARLVFDSRELYAALDQSAGRPHVAAVWSAVERRFIRQADVVLTVGDAIADRLADRYGIARPVVLYNAPEGARPTRTDALQRLLGVPDDGRTLVLYAGLFRAGRGLHTLLSAAEQVDRVRVVLIGRGDRGDALREHAARLGDRAFVHPFVPPDRLPPLEASADVGACLYEPLTESLRLSLPNKLFEYLSAGLPVVASPLPELRRVVEAHRVGVLADPADPRAVADALRHLAEPAVRAAYAANTGDALAAFSWTHGAPRFLRSIRPLLPSR